MEKFWIWMMVKLVNYREDLLYVLSICDIWVFRDYGNGVDFVRDLFYG